MKGKKKAVHHDKLKPDEVVHTLLWAKSALKASKPEIKLGLPQTRRIQVGQCDLPNQSSVTHEILKFTSSIVR